MGIHFVQLLKRGRLETVSKPLGHRDFELEAFHLSPSAETQFLQQTGEKMGLLKDSNLVQV